MNKEIAQLLEKAMEQLNNAETNVEAASNDCEKYQEELEAIVSLINNAHATIENLLDNA